MTEQINSKEGQEIHMQEIFDVCVGSVINQLLFGYRFDESNVGEFRKLKAMMSNQMKEYAHPSAAFLFAFPIFRKFPYFRGQWKKLFVYRDSFFAFFNRQIDEHRKRIDYDSDATTDYVAAFLKEQKRREAEGDFESFKHLQLQNVCLDLWIAGMETTSNPHSLWGVSRISQSSDVQAKMHGGSWTEIGSPRAITMADKNNLIFTHEIQRLGNIVPLNLLHETVRPVQVLNFELPEKTGIVAQISSVLYDEEVCCPSS
ncbi:hypothetical protein COOONC_14234 [Cooperia oncophora]